MRIVLVTQWYHPEPVKVISGCAEALSELGHDVTVLTGFPNYPSGRLFEGYRMRVYQRETINGVHVVRVPLYPSHDNSAFRRILNYVSFAFFASLFGPFLIRRSDVVHVYLSPLTAGWAGWILGRSWGVPITCEIQDMWPETLAATGMIRSEKLLRTVAWFAQRLYGCTAAIRVITEGFSANLQKKGIPAEKIHVIPNWAEACDCKAIAADRELACKDAFLGRFTIMFAGNIGEAQHLENVLDAAGLLLQISEIQFVFVGDGVDLERLQTIKRDRKLENVRFLGRYPQEEMPRLFALADVLLVHLKDDPLFRITIPHKTYSYMASGKPVLAAVGGDVAETITRAHAGLVCAAGDPGALAEKVLEFWRMSSDERQLMAENGKRFVQESHNRTHIATQLSGMLASVVRASSLDNGESAKELASRA